MAIGFHLYMYFVWPVNSTYRYVCVKLNTILGNFALLWRHNGGESPVSQLFTQPFIRAQIKDNIEAPRYWPLCGEFTGDRWILRTNGQYSGKSFHLMTSSCRQQTPTPSLSGDSLDFQCIGILRLVCEFHLQSSLLPNFLYDLSFDYGEF